MTDQTLIIGLCIAGYCIVGYALSMWMYVINEHDDAETAAVFAALTFLFWPVGLSGLAGFGLLWLVTHPHRAAAALVQRMNTPAPIQEPGAFKRREEADNCRRAFPVQGKPPVCDCGNYSLADYVWVTVGDTVHMEGACLRVKNVHKSS
jgi:hypothetical protein